MGLTPLLRWTAGSNSVLACTAAISHWHAGQYYSIGTQAELSCQDVKQLLTTAGCPLLHGVVCFVPGASRNADVVPFE